MKKFIQLTCILLISLTTTSPLFSSEEIIKGRQEIFSKNYNTAKAVSTAIKSGDNEKAKELLEEVSKNFNTLLKYFPEDSKTGFDTEALPAIWENSDEFVTLMQNASSNALMLAKKLDDDTTDITSLEKELLWNNCSACHKKFRLKK